MVSIRNIKKGNVSKCGHIANCIWYMPDGVFDSVVCRKVIERFADQCLHYHFINFALRSVSEEHWSSLGPQDQHVTCAIVLFVTSCALVLADQIVVVIIDGAARHQSNLLVFPHYQAIQIKTGGLFSVQRTGPCQFLEICCGL